MSIMATEGENSSLVLRKEKCELHIAMFPWLAFGHIIPFLQLSKFLAKKGHKITFLSTPKNIDRLPNIPSSEEEEGDITLVKLPLPHVDGLPPYAEATMDVHPDDIPYLKKAYDGLEPGLTRFLENSAPAIDLIICDFAPHWLPKAAAKLGISPVFFCIFNAWFFSFFGPTDVMVVEGADPRTKPEDFTVPAKWVPFDNKVAYRIHEINWIMESAGKTNFSGVSDIYRAGMVIKGCDAIIIRHCREFEGEWLNLLAELHQRPVIPLGLMPPPPPELEEEGVDAQTTWITAKKWLDNQNKGSVVYVALGSEVALSDEQVLELAIGLESSGVPFFWVLRKPPGGGGRAAIVMEEFEERVVKEEGRGMVWKTWAPQFKILSHDSVGGFLTHCGWSSIIEGLMLGLPLIMLPFLVDQGLNARVLEDKQLGIEVARNVQDGSFTKQGVAECVRFVMVEKEGAKLREKAKEVCSIFGDRKLHNHYLEEFSLKLSAMSNN